MNRFILGGGSYGPPLGIRRVARRLQRWGGDDRVKLVAPEPIQKRAAAGRWGGRRGAVALKRVPSISPTRLLAREEHVRDRQQPRPALLGVLELLAQTGHNGLGIGQRLLRLRQLNARGVDPLPAPPLPPWLPG